MGVRRGPRRCVPGAVAALLLGSRAGSAQEPSADDQMERPEVRSLSLSGVENVDKTQLLQSIATSESRCKSILLMLFRKSMGFRP